MKTNIWISIICVSVAALVTTGISFTAESQAKDKPAVKNGPKDIPPGWEKIVFIHYRRAPGKPEGTPGRPKPPKDTDCYDFIARGVKWNEEDLPLDVQIDGTNDQGLDTSVILDAFEAGAGAWDVETATGLFDTISLIPGLTVNEDAPDNSNMIVFGDLEQRGAIAVTIVWGYFGGPPSTRRIIEFDMIFDQVDFDWGIVTDPDDPFMDVQNIATHELGHAVGLGDLYESPCTEVTMYGYSAEGETEKQTLEPDDITGLQKLYGE